MSIEFFYDIVSPYSYLAMTQMARIADEAETEVHWRPFYLGAVFKATGNAPPALVPARGQYMLKDLYRWAHSYGTEFNFPSVFPTNSLLAMRALTLMPKGEREVPSLALGKAYWVDGKDLADPAVVAEHVGQDLVDRARDAKDALREATEEAIGRGAFGAPTFFVGDKMYFGNDRLHFVVRAAKS
ncbi:MAG: 2-hydroxychromene-2-carboxylate isomerase [Myxococcota bacterium]|jgi:2-hydroxychromene-2-carboxylate isomerase